MPDPTSDASTEDLLAQAIAAARAGDMRKARERAERGIETAAEATPFHAFLGMLFARSGDKAAAAEHLRRAHEARSGDITIACNLISVLMTDNRDEDALAVATEALAKGDNSLRIARYRGFLAQKLEQFEEAIKAYGMVLERTPDDFECLNNIGNARAGVGDNLRAAEDLRRAIAIDPAAAPTRLNLASTLIALGRNDDAEAVLRKAAEDFPADSHAPYQLYVHYKSQAKQKEAIAAIEDAVDRDPNVAGMQLKLAIEYGLERRVLEAERAFRRAIDLNPLETDAYLGLAIQYEHTNREEDFAPLIELARRNGLDDGPLAFIEALELRRLGNFSDSLQRLEAVPPDVEKIRTVHVRATLLERLLRTDEAFESYAETNRLMAESPTTPLERAAKLRAELELELGLLTPDWRDSWQEVEIGDDREDPVFLVGFPRSGTTLLDTFLMGHPGAIVMEEQPPLNIVSDELGGMAVLPALDSAGVAAARRRYFEEVEKIQPLVPGKLLIDKSPLFLYRAPLIRRLFPRARIILALRHPCDVVLSCFMSNFRLNTAMANFLHLKDAADFYDISFSHWRKSAELFELNAHTIVYERLIEDVSAELNPLLGWLGLERNQEMLDHRKTAKSRGLITTASYSQVTEPIYKRASGRWERYRAHLEPIVDILAPWAMEFGYGDPRLTVDR
ncbi:MAG: sulfotransferase [Pseudomonadota bacterium]